MISKEVLDTLALTSNETKLYEFLKKQPGSDVADMSRGTHIPRMSVYLSLTSLKKRGLIDYSRKGKRRYWQTVDDKTFVARVIDIARSLTDTHEIRVDIKDTGFAILHGIEALHKVWKNLEDLPRNTRVQAIQPTASIKHALEKLDWQEKIKPLQENILKKSIIIDGVLPEDYYTYMMKYYEKDPKLQKQMLESFIGRSTDMTFVSEKYFKNAESELIILPDVAYLVDWKNEVAVEIRNSIMLTFLRELYELAKGYGKKVNQNIYLKELQQKTA